VFRLPSLVVNKLFNSEDMSAEDFATQFLRSYNLPEFKESRPGWECTSLKGFRVRISRDKSMTVEAIPSSKERKFD
jgi:hypothetical protein